MKKITIIFILAFSSLFTQKHNAGVYVDYQALFISDAFKYSPFAEDEFGCGCFNEFNYSEGYQIGLDYNYKINNTIFAGTRLGMVFNEQELSNNVYGFPTEIIVRDPETNEITDRYITQINTDERIYVNVNFFAFEPYGKFKFGKLNIIAGPSLYIMTKNRAIVDLTILDQEKEIIFHKEDLPDNINLSENGKKITFHDGEIPDKNTFLPGIILGVNYDILYKDFAISPEMLFRYNFTHLSSDNWWLINSLNLGVSVSYKFQI